MLKWVNEVRSRDNRTISQFIPTKHGEASLIFFEWLLLNAVVSFYALLQLLWVLWLNLGLRMRIFFQASLYSYKGKWKNIFKRKEPPCWWIGSSSLYHIKFIAELRSRADGVSEEQMAFLFCSSKFYMLNTYKIWLWISLCMILRKWLKSMGLNLYNRGQLQSDSLSRISFSWSPWLPIWWGKDLVLAKTVITSCDWSRKITSQRLTGLNETNCHLNSNNAWILNAF